MTAITRILGIAQVEMLRLMRLRIALTMVLLVPALQVVLFGYAIRPHAGEVDVAIAAPSEEAAQHWADQLASESGLRVVAALPRPGAARAMVADGKAAIGLEIAAAQPVPKAGTARFTVVVDATNAALTETAAARIEGFYWQASAGGACYPDQAKPFAITRLYNPEARADWTFLPALVGVTVMIAMIMLGTISVARERETGVWESLQSLPVGPGEALAGKLIPHVAIGTAQGAMVLGVGFALFELPITPGAIGLLLLLPAFAAAHFSLGYLISSRATTQLAALQGAVAFYLPAMLLSGFLYPFATLPDWAQAIGNLFPLTHFIAAAQAAILQDRSVGAVLEIGAPIAAVLLAAILLALVADARARR